MSRAYAGVKRALIAVVFASPPTALAGNLWDGGGSNNNWTTGANWNSDNQPPANNGSIDVVMAGTTRLMPNVNAAYDIHGLLFNFDAGAFVVGGQQLTIRGGGIAQFDTQTQTINNTIQIGASQTWDAISGPLAFGGTINLGGGIPRTLNVTGPFPTTINAAIQGFGTLAKAGASTLTLSGSTSQHFVGATLVNEGTILLNKSDGPGMVSNFTIGDGVGLDVVKCSGIRQLSHSAGNTVNIKSSGLFDINGCHEVLQDVHFSGGTLSTGAGTVEIFGNITTTAAATPARILGAHHFNGVVTVADGAAADDLIMDGELDRLAGGAAGITKQGAGQLVLRGYYSYAAPEIRANAGTVVLDKINPCYLYVGDGVGGVGTDVARCARAHQMYLLEMYESGRLELESYLQTPSFANLHGGEIDTGAGTLSPASINVQASADTARIVGNGTVTMRSTRVIDVVDNAPVVDVEVTASISAFVKTGPGRMLLSGAAPNAPGQDVIVNGGELVLGKTVADGAIRQNVSITNGANLLLAGDEQITALPGTTVTIHSGGFLLNGFTETVDVVDLIGATVSFGGGKLATRLMSLGSTSSLDIGTGTLLVSEHVNVFPAGTDIPIVGNFDLGGGICTTSVSLEGAPADLDISAVIRNGALTKTGPGQLVFSGNGNNTYAGATTVNHGTLLLSRAAGANAAVPGPLVIGDGTTVAVVRTSADEQIANGSPLTVKKLASFDISSQTETIGGVTMSGGSITTGTGTLIIGGNISHSGNATSTISGNLDLGGVTRTLTVGTGTEPIALDVPATIHNGGLLVQGGGSLRLSGSNTFAGGMTITAGTLLIGNDAAAGAATLTVADSSLVADTAPRTLNNPLHFSGPTTIDRDVNLTLNGALVNDIGNPITKRGTSTLTITGPQSHAPASTFDVHDGTVTFASDCGSAGTGGAKLILRVVGGAPARVNFTHSQHLANLIASTGTTDLAAGGARVIVANGLFIDTTDAFVDLWEHAAVIDYTGPTQYDAIASYIAAARNGGTWDGSGGLTSSAAALHPTHSTTLGTMEGSAYDAAHGSSTPFHGESVDDSAVLIKYTWYGDSNLSGSVDFDDYVRIDIGFNTNLTGWSNGDFNYSGSVNFDDYVLIDIAFNTQSGTLGRAVSYLSGEDRRANGMADPALQEVVEHFGQFGASYAASFLAAVPEPTAATASSIGIGLAALIRRRRSKSGSPHWRR